MATEGFHSSVSWTKATVSNIWNVSGQEIKGYIEIEGAGRKRDCSSIRSKIIGGEQTRLHQQDNDTQVLLTKITHIDKVEVALSTIRVFWCPFFLKGAIECIDTVF